MNSVVEKLAAIEKEIAAIQPRIEPMSARIDALHQKAAAFSQQMTDIAAETSAVKEEVEAVQAGLRRLQSLIGESKVESEQLLAGQEENTQRCETMTAVFGAAFQAVSQFFEAAQKMGLADQAKAVFLPPSAVPTLGIPAPETHAPADTEPEEPEMPVPDALEPDAPLAEPDIVDNIPALPNVFAEPVPETDDEPMDTAVSDTDEPNANMPETEETDAEYRAAVAAELDVTPLNLAVPDLPDPVEPSAVSHEDEQEIEDMLASMMTPVTTENV